MYEVFKDYFFSKIHSLKESPKDKRSEFITAVYHLQDQIRRVKILLQSCTTSRTLMQLDIPPSSVGQSVTTCLGLRSFHEVSYGYSQTWVLFLSVFPFVFPYCDVKNTYILCLWLRHPGISPFHFSTSIGFILFYVLTRQRTTGN